MTVPGNLSSPLLATAAAGAAAAAGPIKSVRFNSADSAYLNRTPSSAGNRTTWTWAGWIKRSSTGNQRFFTAGANGTYDSMFQFVGSGTHSQLEVWNYQAGDKAKKRTTALFRDFSAWYHIVVSCTSSTLKIYVNGTEADYESGSSNVDPDGSDWSFNSTVSHTIGKTAWGSEYFNGCLADVYWIDGQAKDPTDFGAFDDNGVWQAAAYSGTYGTNGYHLLDFANESGIGDDSSGNDNDWTANNFTASSNNWANYVYAGDATYSSTETGRAYYTGTGDDLFDGTTNNYVGGENVSGSHLYFRPKTAITGVTSIKLYGAYNGETRVNGSVVTVSPAWSSSDQYVTVQSPPSSITEISVKGADGGYTARLKAIEVNGSMLTDSPAKDVDVLFDVPTNGTQSDTGAGGEVSGNHATLNPLVGGATLSNGNLDYTTTAKTATSTIGVTSGKYYAEVNCNDGGGAWIGIINTPNERLGSVDTNTIALIDGDGDSYDPSSTQSYSSYSGFSQGDVVGIALDATNKTLDFYVNGIKVKTYTTFTVDGPYFFAIDRGASVTQVFSWNFGQRAFAYSAPSGFKALCTTNLPTPTIADGSAQFDAKLYTGASGNVTVSTSFGPDFVWLKNRSHADGWHQLRDAVRGGDKNLSSNSTNAESDASNKDLDFNSDGFTLTGTTDSRDDNYDGDSYIAWAWNAGANSNKTYTVTVVSDSGNKYRFDGHGTSAVTLDLAEGSTYVFDQSDSSNSGHPLRFSTTSDGTHGSGSEYTTGVTTTGTPGSAGAKTTIVVAASAPTLYYYCSAHSGMGGQANTNSTAGASNFDGTIQCTVKASQEAGFSIIKYTGNGSANQSIGHNLNSKPSLIFIKSRDNSRNWVVIPAFINDGHFFYLNDTSALLTGLGVYYGTHTSSVVGISGSSSGSNSNANGEDYLCLAFAPVAGYSAIGSYTGNGSSDGPFVALSFRPSLIILKNADATADWKIYDSSRDPDNAVDSQLYPSASYAESDGDRMDFLSNGFKLRTSGSEDNGSGNTYIYYAVAENPFSANGGLAR